jgi:hypothetical protein
MAVSAPFNLNYFERSALSWRSQCYGVEAEGDRFFRYSA